VLANLAGRVIADLYAGNHDPWRDCPFYEVTVGHPARADALDRLPPVHEVHRALAVAPPRGSH
jgi:hypothetical protein